MRLLIEVEDNDDRVWNWVYDLSDPEDLNGFKNAVDSTRTHKHKTFKVSVIGEEVTAGQIEHLLKCMEFLSKHSCEKCGEELMKASCGASICPNCYDEMRG